MAEVSLRPATAADAPAMNDIHKYYVQNTVITFQLECFQDAEFLAKLEKVQSENLPFVVAVTSAEKLVGYCSTSHFRGALHGYHHTVELSLFCHPEYRGKGIGRKLLEKQIEILRDQRAFPEYVDPMPEDREILQVIACMSIDDSTPKRGDELRDYYASFGFVERGRLHRVGHKLGRW